jgi:methylamine dehydrogenase accessory protein MauD
MTEAFYISLAVLWVVVLAMAALQLALLRQIGVLHERIAPMGALTIDKGPKEGEAAPQFDLIDLGRRAVKLGGQNPRGKSTLVFFLSPTCPVCKKMLPILRSMASSETRRLEIVLASDGEREEHERFIARQDLGAFPYVLSQDLGMTYRVSKLPYAVLIDEGGVIRAKGLINTREHLESLIEAQELGIASIQDYLQSTRSRSESQPL